MKARSTAKRISSTPAKRGASERSAPREALTNKYEVIRRDLQRQREAILQEATEGIAKQEKPEAFPDVNDQASAEADRNFIMRIKEREQKLLKKIDEALDRIKSNTYGICEGCEEEIPYQRLKARPVTTFCIACKTLQEQEEKFRR